MLLRPPTRLAVLVSVLLLSVGLLGATIASAETKHIEIKIENRDVTQGGPTVRVSEGDTVELIWQTDEAVELHFHGYDIELDVEPGTPAVMRFDAGIAGRFPVTSHGFAHEEGHMHRPLLYIEVHPK